MVQICSFLNGKNLSKIVKKKLLKKVEKKNSSKKLKFVKKIRQKICLKNSSKKFVEKIKIHRKNSSKKLKFIEKNHRYTYHRYTYHQTLGCDVFSCAAHARPHFKNCSARTCARTSIFE